MSKPTLWASAFLVFSNAHWLHPHYFVNKLRDCPKLSGMLISLHGACAEIHEAFTDMSGSFQQAADNIRLATENGISIAISTIINHFTWNEIEEIVILEEDLGAHHSPV